MSQPNYISGFFGTALVAGTTGTANFEITKWDVDPTCKYWEFMNSGSGVEVGRQPNFKDVKVTLEYDYDVANDQYGITDTSITNPTQVTTPKLFVGCFLTKVSLYLNCTTKGTPAGGVIWLFNSLLVTGMPQSLDVKAGIPGKLICMGAGLGATSSSYAINAWGMQTVTPP
jgi:hypothetical protein